MQKVVIKLRPSDTCNPPHLRSVHFLFNLPYEAAKMAPLLAKSSTAPTKKQGKAQKPMSENVIVRMFNFLPRRVKGHAVAFFGELAGTFLFMLFGQGALNSVNDAPKTGENVSQNLAADSSKLLFISLAFGFSLAINAWIFFRVSGGLFNPAVTLGMCLIGAMGVVRGIIIFIAQIIGGIAAAAAVHGLTPGPLKTRTQLNDGTSVVQGLFIEVCHTLS